MAHPAFRVAAQLAQREGLQRGQRLSIPALEAVMAKMHGHFHWVVLQEVRNILERHALGESQREVIGKRWRADHGLGRPYHSGWPKGKTYGQMTEKDRAALAKRRKAAKASRIRDRLAHGAKRVSGAIRTMFRGNTRGS